jgi:hypothetical protein
VSMWTASPPTLPLQPTCKAGPGRLIFMGIPAGPTGRIMARWLVSRHRLLQLRDSAVFSDQFAREQRIVPGAAVEHAGERWRVERVLDVDPVLLRGESGPPVAAGPARLTVFRPDGGRRRLTASGGRGRVYRGRLRRGGAAQGSRTPSGPAAELPDRPD